MTPRPDASPRGFLKFWWLAVVAGVLGFVAWDTAVRVRHVRQVTSAYGVTVDAPAGDPLSPTGYALGKRSVILPDRDMDGYHWIMQTQAMIADGSVRVRDVDYDGAPTGRAVHWAIPFHAWLVFLAWIDHAWTGHPWGVAVERAAVVSGPVLFAVLLALATPLLARRFSPTAAALCAVLGIAASPFYVDFVAGYADHHGLANACGLLAVLFLTIAGHSLNEASTVSRRWVAASALAGAVGLWVSAATIIPVLAGLGIGAAAACVVGRGTSWTLRPALFRQWGAMGAAASVAAYLLEYFPGHLGLRLEVNHPLYALAWLGAGEALCRLARLLSGRAPEMKPRDRVGLALAVSIVALPLIAILATKDTSFLVADSFLWRLHHDFIAEFQSLPDYLSRRAFGWTALAPCLPVLIAFIAIAMAAQRSRPAEMRAQLALAATPALVLLPFVWSQIRWWGLEIALLVPALATLVTFLPSSSKVLRTAIAGVVLLFAPGILAAVKETNAGGELGEDDIRSLAERDIAQWLRQRAGRRPVVVAGSPTVTTSLVFHGGLRGVGTLYWENIAGLKSSAALYAAPDEAAARAIVERCGITHIVVVSWDGFEGAYVRLARSLEAKAPIPEDTFIVQLLRAGMPPAWLRPLPFALPPHPALDGQQVRIFEVTPDQSRAAALVHTAAYLLESGLAKSARQMVPALEECDDDAPAAAMRAEIASRNQDAAGLHRAVSRLEELLPGSPPLPAEDRIRIVAALASAGRYDPARAELEACLRDLREPELRRLPVASLVSLLLLCDAAQTDWPNPALRALALRLVPPSRRK